MDYTWLITIASIIGTVANIYKKQWCFIIWLFTNFLWMAIDAAAGLYSQAALFAVYFLLSVWGLYQWSREAIRDSSNAGFKSNCLIEAIKAKIINPRQNKIYKRGSWLSPWPHFYWYHRPHDKYYCFSQKDVALSLLQQLWYEGNIVEVESIRLYRIGGLVMKYKLGDIYEENGIYFIVTELTNDVLSSSIPLSRYILTNFRGTTEEALEVLKEEISKIEANK